MAVILWIISLPHPVVYRTFFVVPAVEDPPHSYYTTSIEKQKRKHSDVILVRMTGFLKGDCDDGNFTQKNNEPYGIPASCNGARHAALQLHRACLPPKPGDLRCELHEHPGAQDRDIHSDDRAFRAWSLLVTSFHHKPETGTLSRRARLSFYPWQKQNNFV